jgi:hypothetical protein
MNNEYKNLIKEIIKEQSNIVGDKIAINRAEASKAIKFNKNDIELLTDPKDALKKLIESFAEIFGEASTEVCNEVIKKHNMISSKSKKIR